MERDTLELLKEIIDDGSPQRRIVELPNEPAHIYGVVTPAGEIVRTAAFAAPSIFKPADLDTLVRIARETFSDQTQPDVEIWYSRNGVNADLDRSRAHHDWAFLALTPSPQMTKLIEWDRSNLGVKLTQQQFVLLLRTLFAGCCNTNVLDAVRQIKTARSADINSQIAQGKASVGKSMIAEMTGAGGVAVFEMFTLNIPIFAQAAVPVSGSVRVEVDPDPINEQFTLIVRPGDIEIAFAQAEETIRSRLESLLGKECPIPLYRGSPS